MLSKKLIKAAAGNAAPTEYEISRSLRFNSADSAYLSRTPASAGNRKTATYSFWIKRSKTGVEESPFSSGAYFTNLFEVLFLSSDILLIQNTPNSATRNLDLRTSQVFRDTSAWQHILIAIDTTQATASNRAKLYVNGTQVTAFSTETYPSQNADLNMNTAVATYIGRRADGNYQFNGYLADYYFVDGQALTPSDFGETDATTGVWKPKAYAGTYGTNGFHLDFSDNTSTTALGYDAAGSNDWTPNNFSVTAGAGNDSLVDTPTPYGDDTGVGGEVRGNYCTLNPLAVITGSSSSFAQGNLYFVGGNTGTIGTMGIPTTGKWYWEVTIEKLYTLFAGIHGVYKTKDIGTYAITSASYAYVNTQSTSQGVYKNGVRVQAVAGAATNDVIGCAYNADTLSLQFYRNGSAYGSAITLDADEYIPFTFANGNNTTDGAQFNYNFGQRPFAYTAPSGFKALCTQNLPTPTVVQGDDYFNTVLYTGTGSSQSITGVGFQPDLVWMKSRSASRSHALVDAVRDRSKILFSDLTLAELTSTATQDLTSFDVDGFSVGTVNNAGSTNTSGDTIVAWNWNAGGSNATNTDGTITSTVRANPTAGFSIVSYTGAGGTDTVGHGLGVVPDLYIIKRRTGGTENWYVYTQKIDGSLDYLLLNTTAAKADSAASAPTSTVFSVSSSTATGATGSTYIAYCFAEVEGFSKFGKYTGNGSTNGPFVYCGFRPAFVLIKVTTTTASWYMLDAVRDGYNVVEPALIADNSLAESSINPAGAKLDLVSNGFKLRATSGVNASNQTYIFAAFAENPFKYSLAR